MREMAVQRTLLLLSFLQTLLPSSSSSRHPSCIPFHFQIDPDGGKAHLETLTFLPSEDNVTRIAEFIAQRWQLNAQGEDHLDNLVSDASAKKDNHRQYVKRLAIWYKGFKIKGKILFVCCKCRPNSSAYLVVHFSRPDSRFARQINLCPPSPLTAM